MITVYFVQHGRALTKDIDKTRPLSDTGADEVRKVASKLKNSNVSIQKIVHSGKLRAHQSALIFAEVLGLDKVSETQGMNPNDVAEDFIKQINEDEVMYIGHLPNIQNVVANLVTSNQNNNVIKFQNSAVVCVEINEDESHINWFITPELC